MSDGMISRSIPSVLAFRGMKDAERRFAYMKGFQALHGGRAPNPEKRERLLAAYVEAAGWDQNTVRTMQAAVQTPIR